MRMLVVFVRVWAHWFIELPVTLCLLDLLIGFLFGACEVSVYFRVGDFNPCV